MKIMLALRKQLECRGIINLPELVDVEDHIKELTEQLDAVREAVPMFLEDYQVDDFWAEVKLQAGEE